MGDLFEEARYHLLREGKSINKGISSFTTHSIKHVAAKRRSNPHFCSKSISMAIKGTTLMPVVILVALCLTVSGQGPDGPDGET